MVTGDRLQMTCDMWLVTHDIFHKQIECNLVVEGNIFASKNQTIEMGFRISYPKKNVEGFLPFFVFIKQICCIHKWRIYLKSYSVYFHWKIQGTIHIICFTLIFKHKFIQEKPKLHYFSFKIYELVSKENTNLRNVFFCQFLWFCCCEVIQKKCNYCSSQRTTQKNT